MLSSRTKYRNSLPFDSNTMFLRLETVTDCIEGAADEFLDANLCNVFTSLPAILNFELRAYKKCGYSLWSTADRQSAQSVCK